MEKKTASKRRKQRGYTLLEYCAGAAVMGAIVYGAMNMMGTGLSSAFSNIGSWAVARTAGMTASSSSTAN